MKPKTIKKEGNFHMSFNVIIESKKEAWRILYLFNSQNIRHYSYLFVTIGKGKGRGSSERTLSISKRAINISQIYILTWVYSFQSNCTCRHQRTVSTLPYRWRKLLVNLASSARWNLSNSLLSSKHMHTGNLKKLAEVNGLELKSMPRHLRRNKDECWKN